MDRLIKEYSFSSTQDPELFREINGMREGVVELVDLIQEKSRKGNILILVTGAWGVGKTTFGKALKEGLGSEAEYYDGDSSVDYPVIQGLLKGGVKNSKIAIVGASFSENWMSEEERERLKGSLIVVNLVADETTRHQNFFSRQIKSGRSHDRIDVASIFRSRAESPNYISPHSDIRIDTSEKFRIAPEEVVQLVSDATKLKAFNESASS